jgi:hypothetical protein
MEPRGRILYICGSMNQTTQMHQISRCLGEYEAWFTPYYDDGFLGMIQGLRLLEFTVLGEKHARRCVDYLGRNDLRIDRGGAGRTYDLVVTCADLIIPKNITRGPIVLVQEGMTDPEGLTFKLVRNAGLLPRWIASTSAMGLSGAFEKFCVASDGYRELFIRKGVDPSRIVVTGIPNFDDSRRYLENDFPRKGYVLACTSDSRETFHYENRMAFIRRVVNIAAGRQILFKLHPNERHDRATREIKKLAPPGTIVYSSGNTGEMIANCEALVTRLSSTVYVGMALGKTVYSDFPVRDLRRLMPVQNGGRSAEAIAEVCRDVLGAPAIDAPGSAARETAAPVIGVAAGTAVAA